MVIWLLSIAYALIMPSNINNLGSTNDCIILNREAKAQCMAFKFAADGKCRWYIDLYFFYALHEFFNSFVNSANSQPCVVFSNVNSVCAILLNVNENLCMLSAPNNVVAFMFILVSLC